MVNLINSKRKTKTLPTKEISACIEIPLTLELRADKLSERPQKKQYHLSSLIVWSGEAGAEDIEDKESKGHYISICKSTQKGSKKTWWKLCDD